MRLCFYSQRTFTNMLISYDVHKLPQNVDINNFLYLFYVFLLQLTIRSQKMHVFMVGICLNESNEEKVDDTAHRCVILCIYYAVNVDFIKSILFVALTKKKNFKWYVDIFKSIRQPRQI